MVALFFDLFSQKTGSVFGRFNIAIFSASDSAERSVVSFFYEKAPNGVLLPLWFVGFAVIFVHPNKNTALRIDFFVIYGII